ncbi:DUF4383 domain-containing protein [Paenibacillus daejeonensis]|uniref:DUF4383 domain-containing protein n=1 Tax=Paenibacillus daejeonensis TaxID=135193 RepID=UPI00037EC802|nr:DUF4383 domain-containing protein [Paenibacillus daejeonensis]
MAARRFAALAGLVFGFMGIVGLFADQLFGLLHLHSSHTVLYLLAGLLGLLAASEEGYACRYAQVLGTVTIVLSVLGVFTGNVFGLMTLGLADHILHFITGAIALYIGFVLVESRAPVRSRRTV